MFKFVILVASCLAAANAGLIASAPLAYSSYAAAAPAYAYSGLSPTIIKSHPAALPLSYAAAAPAIAYSNPTTIVKSHISPVSYNSYSTYNSPAIVKTALPVAYSSYAAPAPILKAAPLAYAAHATPLAYAAHPAPLSYSAYSAGIVKAAPLAYSAPIW